jgi:hypothetical protein
MAKPSGEGNISDYQKVKEGKVVASVQQWIIKTLVVNLRSQISPLK